MILAPKQKTPREKVATPPAAPAFDTPEGPTKIAFPKAINNTLPVVEELDNTQQSYEIELDTARKAMSQTLLKEKMIKI